MSLGGSFKTVECGRCHGTGVRYCCGNRDAEMTCRACCGAGRGLVWVADPPKEATVAIDSVRMSAVGEEGVTVQLGRTPQPGCIDVGILNENGSEAWARIELSDLFTSVQAIRATAAPAIEAAKQEARRA